MFVLEKQKKNPEYPPPNYTGIDNLPDLWLVGYGLDDKGDKRNILDLWAMPKTKGVPLTQDDWMNAAIASLSRRPLIRAAELQQVIAARTQDCAPLRILDSTLSRPIVDEDKDFVYKVERIPQATFVDIDGVSHPSSGLPHTMPTQEQFRGFMRDLDIARGDQLVIYDDICIAGAARLWWMFRVYGVEALVLDGGFKQWKEAGFELETGEPAYQRRDAQTTDYDWTVQRDQDVFDINDVNQCALDIRENQDSLYQIIDARSKGRFEGT